ncbi:MAG: glycosyltransferase family 9 protein [Ignavibacteria bacterium]|nr:glycosyltransferase family 9 protein [Ignavibacteria bacterium]
MKSVEIKFRKFLLRLLLLIKKSEKQKEIPPILKSTKILFIRLNRIGDALVSTPLLYEIKKYYGCTINVLAGSKNYFIFTNTDLSDEVIVFNKKLKSISDLIKVINERNYDIIVDLHDDVSTTVSYIMAFSKCEHKVGLDKENKKLYNYIIPKLNPQTTHIVDRIMNFNVAFNFVYDQSKINIRYQVKPESQERAEQFLNKHFPVKRFLMGINISAGSDARFWGESHYKELISSISNYKADIVIMCLEKDLRKAWEISVNKYPIFFRPSFDDFAAMIKNLNLLVTPDTSVVHIASAFIIPLFGIYVQYDTDDEIWYPYKSPYECVVTSEATLHNISFNSVKNKFIPFFEKYYGSYNTK